MTARRKKGRILSMARLMRMLFVFLLMGSVLAAIGWAVVVSGRGISRMDLWRVRFVRWPEGFPRDETDALSASLIGRNLFRIDLKSLERSLRRRYPQWQGLRVERILPNGLSVIATPRRPLMILKTDDAAWLLDDRGWIIQEAPPSVDVPVIDMSRLSVKPSRQKAGFPLRWPQVRFARTVVKTFTQDELSAWRLSSCVWESAELFFCEVQKSGHDRSLRVLFDRDTFEQRWPALSLLGQRADLNWNDINYIDLRQRDPILGWMTSEQGKRVR